MEGTYAAALAVLVRDLDAEGVVMAIQIDYFIAADDDALPPPPTSNRGRAGVPFDDENESPQASYDVVPSQNVDPGLALGFLNERLTGVPVEEFVTGGWPALVAVRADEQKYVLQVDPGFVALMTTREAPFEPLAEQWAAVEAPAEAEPWQPRPRDLAEFLHDFIALCSKAGDEGGHVYCWLWP